MFELGNSYCESLNQIWGASATRIAGFDTGEESLLNEVFERLNGRLQAFYVEGLNLRCLISPGAHCVPIRRDDSVGIVLVTLEPVGSKEEAREIAKKLSEEKEPPAPENYGPVFQIIREGKTLTDFRTGLVIPARPSVDEFRAMLLSALALAPEVQKAVQSSN
jgi:hypothetical protein